ncbi:hypothetical protein [Streptomyces sp. NPDC002588]|uniref:hypothetical protein n=1 Tax=Streptomyces sp. NPDC002588 TaxID=3154419 RepID=UPI00332291F2
MVAAEPADLAFDAAFLVGAVDARRAVEDLQAGPGAAGRQAVGLHPGAGEAEDAGDRGGEVVVANFPTWYASQHFKRVEVAFEEGFLPLREEDPVDGLSGEDSRKTNR